MADLEVVEKLKAIVADPEAMARLEQARKEARETAERLRKAGQVNLSDLGKVHYNI